MKKMICLENYHGDIISCDVYVGVASEIKALYKTLLRHEEKHKCRPYDSDFPEFNPLKLYGLAIEDDGFMSVIDADTILHLILDDDIQMMMFKRRY
nr:MAG TPA: hypothetical protein [Caudoviricetes sp.]